jgi:hypothetical protein
MKTSLLKMRVFVFSLPLFWLGLANNTAAAEYTLTLGAIGSGTVTPDNYNNPHPAGVTITITATPAGGWYFSNWSGDTNGSVNPLQVPMYSNLSITGNFVALPTYSLTLATNGQGTIDLNPSGGSYVSNSLVTATATPAAGWVFTSWSGSTNVSTNPLSITMNTNYWLTGTFAQLPTFDIEPQPVTNAAGSTVSFTSHAVGNLPLGYQWYFSGGTLTNATSTTLTLPNIQTANAGTYWNIATNSYGSATSSVVALVITNSIGSTNVVNSPTEASLLAAIQIGGWVSINCNGTFTITNTINITNSVILDGSGVSATISGGNAVRLFYVAPDASLTITNLTLANGSYIVTSGSPGTPADGGAIYNNGGSVNLVSCTLTNNNAQSLIYGGLARGGAIFNNGGNVSLNQSSISNNAVIGGGPNNPSEILATIGTGLGGAIYNTSGSMTISGCNVSSNFCSGICVVISDPPGTGLTMGGAVFQASGSMIISSSTFALNLALGCNGFGTPATPAGQSYGGALAANGGSLTIYHGQFFANTAEGGNAGYHGAAGPAYGGAIYSASALSVIDSMFIGNQLLAGNGTVVPQGGTTGVDGCGGAIYNSGTAVLNRCSVSSNYVQGGYAVGYADSAANGGNGFGGGIFNASQFSATNCTIALNSTVSGDGSLAESSPIDASGNALGGGVFNNTNATFIAMNLTIASNNCSSPSGQGYTNGLAAGTQIANTNGTLQLHNSIIAYGGADGNSYGSMTDIGYNICSDGTAHLLSGTSYNYTDPLLAPLANYGGPTLCMALQSDSPAIGSGDISGAPPTDQRGYPRTNGAGVDIGAYQYSVVPQMSLSCSSTGMTICYTAFPSYTYRLQFSTNLYTWTDFTTNGPFSTVSNIDKTICGQVPPIQFFRLKVQ